MTHLETLLRKYDEDALFRRVCIGSPTWAEMVIEAYMKDLTGNDMQLARPNQPSIDIVAPDGRHVQVKRLNSINSQVTVRAQADMPAEIMIVTTYGERPHFYRVPKDAFISLARSYAKGGVAVPPEQAGQWEISGSRIRNGVLAPFEVTPEHAVPFLNL